MFFTLLLEVLGYLAQVTLDFSVVYLLKVNALHYVVR